MALLECASCLLLGLQNPGTVSSPVRVSLLVSMPILTKWLTAYFLLLPLSLQPSYSSALLAIQNLDGSPLRADHEGLSVSISITLEPCSLGCDGSGKALLGWEAFARVPVLTQYIS